MYRRLLSMLGLFCLFFCINQSDIGDILKSDRYQKLDVDVIFYPESGVIEEFQFYNV